MKDIPNKRLPSPIYAGQRHSHSHMYIHTRVYWNGYKSRANQRIGQILDLPPLADIVSDYKSRNGYTHIHTHIHTSYIHKYYILVFSWGGACCRSYCYGDACGASRWAEAGGTWCPFCVRGHAATESTLHVAGRRRSWFQTACAAAALSFSHSLRCVSRQTCLRRFQSKIKKN